MTKAKPKAQVSTFKLLEGTKAIEASIKSISTRGKAFERDIHVTAVSCLVHADKHGDVTLAQRLVDAVPSLARKNALRDWFLAHGKFIYNAKEKQFNFSKSAVTLTEEAIATPFWEFKQEAAYVPFDINKAITQLLARADTAIKKGDNVPEATIKQLRSMIA